MWHLITCKIFASLSLLDWFKNEMIVLSYLWINNANINLERGNINSEIR